MSDTPSHNGEAEGNTPHGSLLKTAVWRNPLVWLTCFTKIMIDVTMQRFTANILQRRVVEVLLYCLWHGLPCRMIILKPRQRGISTITTGLLVWMLQRFGGRGLIIGRKGQQTNNLWEMMRRYVDHDSFPWGMGKARITDEKAEFANGGYVSKESAEAMDPGRSASFQYILATEVAYWAQDGKVKNASGVMAGLMACVKAVARTLVFWESTSFGPSGMYYRGWGEAVSFEEFKANPGKHKGKFIKVFAGWWEFADCSLEVADQAEANAILTGEGALNHDEFLREQELTRKYGLTPGQLKWWRLMLTQSDNDPVKRDLDYPGEPDDAFQAGQLCKFNWAGLKLLRAKANEAANTLQFGSLYRLNEQQKTPIWKAIGSLESGGEWAIAEHPLMGCKYVLSVDTSKGIASGDDRRNLDCHSVQVVREAWLDTQTGRWQPPRVVACITGERRRMGGLLRMEARWEPFVLADHVFDLALYYGNCLVVVENNNDPGVLARLRDKGANLYVEQYDKTHADKAGEQKTKLGFTMGDNSAHNGVRSTIIAELGREITEVATGKGHAIDIPFPWILDELDHFVNNPDTGKCAAAGGWHDDHVMCLAIARAVKGGATVYHAPAVAHAMPGFGGAPMTRERQQGARDSSFRV